MSSNSVNENCEMTTAKQEAAQWLIKMEIEPSANSDDYVAFTTWLQSSAEHERLYEQCLQTWQMSESLSSDPAISSLINQYGEAADAADRADQKPANRGFSSRRMALMTLCASVVLALVTVFTVLQQPVEPLVYQTALGQQQRVELDDGSSVILNTASKISVLYSASARHIRLEKGEALFDVAKDVERPFVVEVGRARVEALGTLFNIHKGSGQIAVTLAEGKVRLSPLHDESVEAFLSPGEQAIIRSSGAINSTQVADVDRVTQWTSGKLAFIDAALEDVITEVNRYSKEKIYIVDPGIIDVKINAYFYIQSIDSLLFALENSFNIKSHKDAGGIYLTQEK